MKIRFLLVKIQVRQDMIGPYGKFEESYIIFCSAYRILDSS